MSDSIYSRQNVPLYEAMYGPGLISLGGYEAVDKMFDGIDLSGRTVLDVGSGIGGMAYHLALQHNAIVTGLEIHAWMAEYGRDHAPPSIKDHVNFITYNEDGSIPASAHSFDVICSKGVLTNVRDKKFLFSELYRLLNLGGVLCLIDWIVPEAQGPQYETRPMGEISCKETQLSYQKILEECGFTHCIFENESDQYLAYVNQLGALLSSEDHQQKFKDIISDELRETLMAWNKKLQQDIESGAMISVRIRAGK